PATASTASASASVEHSSQRTAALDAEGVLDLVEEAAVFLWDRLVAEGRRELAEQLLLLLGQVRRHCDLYPHQQVPAAVLAQIGDTLAAHLVHPAVMSS